MSTESLKTAQTLATRERILRAALKLFNEQGTSVANTHEIARAADLSPGNLYYHFKNKEEIIRELFFRMEIFSESQWLAHGPANRAVGIMDFMRFFLGNLEKYRFFFREFTVLLRNDPVLAHHWRLAYDQLFRVMRGAVHRWTEAGIMKKMESVEEVDDFIEACWILASFSPCFLEMKQTSMSAAAAHERQLLILLRFLLPYHTAKGQRAIELCM
jgi:AcrR family transcriptional regulator